ncbi:MAG: 3'-5' exonuclease [Betaproteobacteria bacterium]|nr:3'-5' exonuclease [Betaproteobacteria bacterium]
MRVPFAVADLETTGFSAASCEIIEIAAVLVDPDGSITGEMSVLVKPVKPIPTEITRLTGITQEEVDRAGLALAEALTRFKAAVGGRGVFFHNAPFDRGFLVAGTATSGVRVTNAILDTLPVAQTAWPDLASYKLSTLASYVGVTTPPHRALADSRAALAVLLAARAKASQDPAPVAIAT